MKPAQPVTSALRHRRASAAATIASTRSGQPGSWRWNGCAARPRIAAARCHSSAAGRRAVAVEQRLEHALDRLAVAGAPAHDVGGVRGEVERGVGQAQLVEVDHGDRVARDAAAGRRGSRRARARARPPPGARRPAGGSAPRRAAAAPAARPRSRRPCGSRRRAGAAAAPPARSPAAPAAASRPWRRPARRRRRPPRAAPRRGSRCAVSRSSGTAPANAAVGSGSGARQPGQRRLERARRAVRLEHVAVAAQHGARARLVADELERRRAARCAEPARELAPVLGERRQPRVERQPRDQRAGLVVVGDRRGGGRAPAGALRERR